jgi:hypothetical protein
MVSFMPFLVSSLVAAISLFFMRKKMNTFMMRFFRDVSRYKSRKRLYGNQAALIPILMGKEEPIEINTDISEHGDDYTMTLAQLSDMDGSTAQTPIYISLNGLIYDVSAARELYGPGGNQCNGCDACNYVFCSLRLRTSGNYHYFAGRDSTRAYATGCANEACLKSANSLENLQQDEKDQIQKWIELYHTHDKYKFVGKLVADPVDAILAAESHNHSR